MKRGRGRAKPSFIPPPTPRMDQRQYGGGRDSDASFASSRPSSIGVARSSAAADLVNDRSCQVSAIRAINSFLTSHSFSPTIQSNLPSAKDITSIVNFIISQFDYSDPKMEEDLPILLKSLNCPFKISKSALRTPATPHAWPTFLAVLHWLVQITMYNEHLASSSRSFAEGNSMYRYALESYFHFIQGDDFSVEALDKDFIAKLEQEKDNIVDKAKVLEVFASELEAKVEALRTGPSERELLEKEKAVLEEDVKKFNAIVEEVSGRTTLMEKEVEEKEKKLKAKAEEEQMICEENEELKKTLQLQTVNPRAVERMKRELHALERDIADSETERNNFEEKCWDLDGIVSHKLKELEELALECNKAIRKLKLGSDSQYVLNAKGCSPAEVMGIDYKSTLKPVLDSYVDAISKSSMVKVEELIALRQHSIEVSTKVDQKHKRIPQLDSQIEKLDAELNFVKAETQDYVHRCALEAKQMVDDIKEETQTMALIEAQAAEVLKTSEVKLEEAVKEGEEENRKCGGELFALVDSVSKYKEFMEAKLSEMMNAVSGTAKDISKSRRNALPKKIAQCFEATQKHHE